MQKSFDKFTGRARQVLTLAQEEARNLNQAYIGPEHLLLGLLREGNGIGAKVLTKLGLDLAQIRKDVAAEVGQERQAMRGELSLNPQAKRIIELAVDEAGKLNHDYIGTEHLLLGLVAENEGVACKILQNHQINPETVRQEVEAVINQIVNPAQNRRPKKFLFFHF